MRNTTAVSEEISVLIRIMVETVHPEKIYLFGSSARGEQNPDSDYDFYIVMNDNAERAILIMRKIRKAIRDYKQLPVDIIVSKSTSFRERTTLPTLEKAIVTEGILLYEKAQDNKTVETPLP